MSGTIQTVQGYLEVRDPSGQVRCVPLESERLLIGRSGQVQLTLDSASVSRRHAELFCDPFGRWWVRDLGSRNGTKVNGAVVNEQVVGRGDTIEIASFAMKVVLPVPVTDTLLESNGTTGILVSDSPSATINTLNQVGTPKIDTRQLFALQDFGRRLIEVHESAERLRLLCRLMVAQELRGRFAAALRVDRSRPDDPPAVLCGPETSDLAPAGEFHVSRTLLHALCKTTEPMLASNVSSGAQVVELSIAAEMTAMSVAACPLRSNDNTLDLLYVVLPAEYGTGEWLALAALASEQYEQAELAWAARRQAQAHAAIERELERARQLQRRLLPQEVHVPGLDLALHFEPCLWVGGDYLDVVPATGGRTLLVVGDVCGKGMQAALVTASLHTWMHAGLSNAEHLSDLIGSLNSYLGRTLPPGSFVTMIALLIDPRTGELECVNAGHPPPMVVDGRGVVRQLHTSVNLPLGVGDEAMVCATDGVAAGEILALYTDGLTEARDEAGRMLGIDGLRDRLGSIYQASHGQGIERFADQLRDVSQQMYAGRLADDDQTFLLAMVTSPDPAPVRGPPGNGD